VYVFDFVIDVVSVFQYDGKYICIYTGECIEWHFGRQQPTCIYIYIYIKIYAQKYVITHIHTQIYMYIHICIHIHICNFYRAKHSPSESVSPYLRFSRLCFAGSLSFPFFSPSFSSSTFVCRSPPLHRVIQASISRLLKIIGLFCRISSLLWVSFAEETYNFKEPTNRRI